MKFILKATRRTVSFVVFLTSSSNAAAAEQAERAHRTKQCYGRFWHDEEYYIVTAGEALGGGFVVTEVADLKLLATEGVGRSIRCGIAEDAGDRVGTVVGDDEEHIAIGWHIRSHRYR